MHVTLLNRIKDVTSRQELNAGTSRAREFQATPSWVFFVKIKERAQTRVEGLLGNWRR